MINEIQAARVIVDGLSEGFTHAKDLKRVALINFGDYFYFPYPYDVVSGGYKVSKQTGEMTEFDSYELNKLAESKGVYALFDPEWADNEKYYVFVPLEEIEALND